METSEEKQNQRNHKRYQRFDEEFKREAVRLSQLDGRTVAGTARSLGIDTNTLGLWRKQFGASVAAEGRAPMTDAAKDREIMELRKRLREAEQERDILKKAVGVISRTRE
jgi:transposase